VRRGRRQGLSASPAPGRVPRLNSLKFSGLALVMPELPECRLRFNIEPLTTAFSRAAERRRPVGASGRSGGLYRGLMLSEGRWPPSPGGAPYEYLRCITRPPTFHVWRTPSGVERVMAPTR
jgi:hypothetical protein